MAKTNIQCLREIVTNNIESTHKDEILEFIEAIQEELSDKDDEIKSLEEENDSDEEPEYDNSSFVGLDTIHWSLENGNLNIEQKMEAFIENLQRQNAVVPA